MSGPAPPGAGSPRRRIVLLHGWTMRGAVFDGLARALGDRFDCVAPDLPGHGAAAGLPPTLDAGARLLGDLVEGAGGPRPLVVGWSMGAAVAWRYSATRGAGRLGGLVTVDMSPRLANGPDWPHGLLGQSADGIAESVARLASDWEGAAAAIAATMFAAPEGAPGFDRERARAMVLSHDPDAMRAVWSELAAMDARPAIPAIDAPYLVCHGARSRVYPASASAWLAATAPRARVLAFRRSGHSPHLEEPAAFARAVTEFADALPA